MLAYTAWDGLQTIARQYDADLTLVANDHIELGPRRRRVASTVRQAVERIAAGVAGLLVTSGLIVA